MKFQVNSRSFGSIIVVILNDWLIHDLIDTKSIVIKETLT